MQGSKHAWCLNYYQLIAPSVHVVNELYLAIYKHTGTNTRYFEDNSTAESDGSVDTGNIFGINSTTYAVGIVRHRASLPAYLRSAVPLHVIAVVEKDSVRVHTICNEDTLKSVSLQNCKAISPYSMRRSTLINSLTYSRAM